MRNWQQHGYLGSRSRPGGFGPAGREGVSLERTWLEHRRGLWLLGALGLVFAEGPLRAQEWETGTGHRSRALAVPAGTRVGFTLLPGTATGVIFTNAVPDDRALENSLRTSGSGVAAGDVDGDGRCDLYFCGIDGRNSLYRNLGNWRFEEIAERAGVSCAGQESTGAVLADVDGDRDVDLLVNGLGRGTRLFLNDGQGKFTESLNSGLLRRYGATSMALADVDGNGTLDLYVANYATTKIEDRPNARFESKRVGDKIVLTAIDGIPMTSPDLTNRYYVDGERVVRELGEPDAFYLGDGRGGFRLQSWTGGMFADDQGRPLATPYLDFGLSVMFRDLNGDRAPDIYICNDLFPPDRIWVNDGRGGFRGMSNLALRQTCRFAMGVDVADVNRDGHDDFFVVDMLSRDHAMRMTQTVGVLPIFLPVGLIDHRPQYKRNTFYLGRGDGTFAEIAQLAGLEATEWSWMPAFLDVDLDGYEDVLVTTGHTRDSLNADAVAQILKERSGRRLTDLEHRALKKKHYPVLHLFTQAFRNRGDLTFEDRAVDWGFRHEGTSHGMCLADLDGDGDLDVVVNNLNAEAGLYRFDASAPRVAVRLRGVAPNTQGVGARIRVLGGARPQSQEVISGGRYLSGDEGTRMFAVDGDPGTLRIEVTWRSGKVSIVRGLRANRLYEIDEAGAGPADSGPAVVPGPVWFADQTAALQHRHVDAPFDDYERQPLLTRRFSQLGPGVTWQDVDGDGREDLVVGSGAGGSLAVHRNATNGFQRLSGKPWDQVVGRDQTTVLGVVRPDGVRSLLVGNSNYEDGQPQGSLAHEFAPGLETPRGGFPGWEVSVGPMSQADLNGDGLLDLFVGGRIEPAKYPDTPSSLVFRGTAGKFEVDGPNCQALSLIGMASGSVFTDLDGDGDADLVLACDWGAVRVFRNDQGRLVSWAWPVRGAEGPTGALGDLAQMTGFWNGVVAGDFDGDGRMDLVASNWGRNSRYQTFRRKPLQIVYGEWTVPGVMDVLEAYHDPGLNKSVPWQAYRVARLLPWIVERYQTQTAYSTAGIDELLGERRATAKSLLAVWLESTLFLNRGDHFEVKVLPGEAQFAPGFGLAVADFNGDGAEDVFLAQNFFAVDGETSRLDGGRGVVLAGDGRGGLRPVPGAESGVTIYGEQRGAAAGDYDGDGRVDLAVAQNGAETRLFRNATARPGLRVRIAGRPGNPTGVGVMLRAGDGRAFGPAREIRSGSGYWSQDGAVQVMSAPGGTAVRQIQMRWPGAAPVTVDVPAGTREITLGADGKVVGRN